MEHVLITCITIFLCVLLGYAVRCDISEHRIPNWLVAAILAGGLLGQVVTQGAMGIVYGLGGLATGLMFFLPFYARGGMGAGDVKLMAAVGALLGPLGALMAGALTLIAGLALVIVGFKLRNVIDQMRLSRIVGERMPPIGASVLFVEKNGATRIPYAPAIATGTACALWQLGYISNLNSLVSWL
jgi:prepilin peptidase CpaA